MDREFLVKKSNYFIMNSSYDLSVEEQKIILTLASMVKVEDEEFKRYKFNIAEFMDLVGVKNKQKYVEIPRITKQLMKKVFEIEEEDTLIQVAWLSSVTYKKGRGYVELEFSPRLKPYMLDLKSRFTQYKLGNVLMMRSKYSSRIYEFLKCNEFKKQKMIEFSLDKLRQLLRAEKTYLLYADFKRYVLNVAQKEINALTDITFIFEEVKKGRKIDSIKFYITPKKQIEVKTKAELEPAATVEPKPDLDDLVDKLREIIKEPLKTKEYKAILQVGKNDMELIKSKYKLAKKAKNIDNLVGWLVKAMEEDFAEPVKKSKANQFNDISSRDYEFDELERELQSKI